MDQDQLSAYLKSTQRSQAAIQRTLSALGAFETWLHTAHGLTIDDEISLELLDAFLQSIDKGLKNLLMGLANVFEFQGRDDLKTAAVTMRRDMLDAETRPMPLRDFLGVPKSLFDGLESRGMRHAYDLLGACRTPADRAGLARELGVPYQDLLALVKMADLSRLFAVKAVRARLYLESGFDTLDKLAALDPMELHLALVRFVEETHFDGIPTTPKEAAGTLKAAKELERLVVFEEEE
jgi:hypothetical protein